MQTLCKNKKNKNVTIIWIVMPYGLMGVWECFRAIHKKVKQEADGKQNPYCFKIRFLMVYLKYKLFCI